MRASERSKSHVEYINPSEQLNIVLKNMSKSYNEMNPSFNDSKTLKHSTTYILNTLNTNSQVKTEYAEKIFDQMITYSQWNKQFLTHLKEHINELDVYNSQDYNSIKISKQYSNDTKYIDMEEPIVNNLKFSRNLTTPSLTDGINFFKHHALAVRSNTLKKTHSEKSKKLDALKVIKNAHNSVQKMISESAMVYQIEQAVYKPLNEIKSFTRESRESNMYNFADDDNVSRNIDKNFDSLDLRKNLKIEYEVKNKSYNQSRTYFEKYKENDKKFDNIKHTFDITRSISQNLNQLNVSEYMKARQLNMSPHDLLFHQCPSNELEFKQNIQGSNFLLKGKEYSENLSTTPAYHQENLLTISNKYDSNHSNMNQENRDNRNLNSDDLLNIDQQYNKSKSISKENSNIIKNVNYENIIYNNNKANMKKTFYIEKVIQEKQPKIKNEIGQPNSNSFQDNFDPKNINHESNFRMKSSFDKKCNIKTPSIDNEYSNNDLNLIYRQSIDNQINYNNNTKSNSINGNLYNNSTYLEVERYSTNNYNMVEQFDLSKHHHNFYSTLDKVIGLLSENNKDSALALACALTHQGYTVKLSNNLCSFIKECESKTDILSDQKLNLLNLELPFRIGYKMPTDELFANILIQYLKYRALRSNRSTDITLALKNMIEIALFACKPNNHIVLKLYSIYSQHSLPRSNKSIPLTIRNRKLNPTLCNALTFIDYLTKTVEANLEIYEEQLIIDSKLTKGNSVAKKSDKQNQNRFNRVTHEAVLDSIHSYISNTLKDMFQDISQTDLKAINNLHKNIPLGCTHSFSDSTESMLKRCEIIQKLNKGIQNASEQLSLANKTLNTISYNNKKFKNISNESYKRDLALIKNSAIIRKSIIDSNSKYRILPFDTLAVLKYYWSRQNGIYNTHYKENFTGKENKENSQPDLPFASTPGSYLIKANSTSLSVKKRCKFSCILYI